MNDLINRQNGITLPLLLSIALILLTIPVLMGADFWEKKEYTKWSKNECTKMLTKSPWAKEFSVSRSSGEAETLDGQLPSIKYMIKFNSALPVRYATIQMNRLQYKYDDLPDAQKQQFDQSANQYLSARFPDIIVISVDFSTNVRNQQIPLDNYWQMQTTELLKNKTYLYVSEDVKAPLMEFVPGQTNFQFVFPRQIDGKPLITAEDKNVKLEFDVPEFGRMGGERALVEFKVEDMMFDNELIY
jgi:hypothetical protein